MDIYGIFYNFQLTKSPRDISPFSWHILQWMTYPQGSFYRFYMVDSAFEVFFISFSKCSALELHAGIFEAF